MRGTKKPFEKDWPNKPYTKKEIEKHIPEENYGVLCGYDDLAVIDCDTEALQVVIDEFLPDTFKVKTGSGGTHNYYLIPDLKKKIILETDKGEHLGEVQSSGTQVVGPGSVHPNGAIYETLNNIEVKKISYKKLLEVISPFMKEIKETEENAQWEIKENEDIDQLNVGDIWGVGNLKKHGNEYYGEHPIHGSEGGMNFWVNPLKNTWHCFRCNSGGGPLSAIAVKEGIIDCSEAQRGMLRGDRAKQAIERAKESYGLQRIEKIQEIVKREDKLDIIWDKDLQSWKEKETEWIIEKIIPNRSVCVLTGKRGTLKTFLALQLGYSLCSGNKFLDNYDLKKAGVLYLDKENGVYIMKKRTRMIKKGLDIEETKKSLDIGFICFSNLKIDKLMDIKKLEEAIEEYRPKLLIIDTYRRVISYDENDASSVSALFVDILRPLVEKYNLSLLLIHHDRKGGGSGDEMDEMRGSSDLANYVDIILKNERKGNILILKQLKNRNAEEEKPIQLEVNIKDQEELAKLEFMGLYEKQTQVDKCVELLTLWITQNKITHFKTKEAQDMAFQAGIRKSKFQEGLDTLINLGMVEKVSHGNYQTKNYKI